MAQAHGARPAALAADLALTTLYATPTPVFDAVAGRALCERTIALARDVNDRAAESKALWNLMTLNVFSGGDPKEAVDAGEASLAIARELDAREQMAFTLNDLWRPYSAISDLKAAQGLSRGVQAAVARAREPSDVLREPHEHGRPARPRGPERGSPHALRRVLPDLGRHREPLGPVVLPAERVPRRPLPGERRPRDRTRCASASSTPSSPGS